MLGTPRSGVETDRFQSRTRAKKLVGAQVATGLQDFLLKAALADNTSSAAAAHQNPGTPACSAADVEPESDVLHWRRRQWPTQAAAAAYQTAFAAAARGLSAPWPGIGVATDGALGSRPDKCNGLSKGVLL